MKILAFGSFDLLHPGHTYFLQKAKAEGSELVVVIARDETIRHVKKKEPEHPEEERLRYVELLPYVDKAVLGDSRDRLKCIREEEPDMICLGYDQSAFIDTLQLYIANENSDIEIKRIEPYMPEKFKSSIIKDSVN